MAERATDVLVEIGGEPVLAGRLWAHRRRRVESASFAYEERYLAMPGAYPFDPALPLVSGQQQTASGRAIFGAFSDCAPDRWGRRLIGRAEERRARREQRAERSFGEIDYLLGVRDDLRQGALRFRDSGSGRFLADQESGVPHVIDLPVLLAAAADAERDDASDAVLQTLLQGGSSLGGARPKAHVIGDGGRISIAKFPRATSDDWDVMRWEAVALRLAREAGVRVPRWTLHDVGGAAVLILERFDRVGARRIGYASAMTMLEARDGDARSYLEIAEVIEAESPNASDDLRQLWRRIAFSVLIRNTDDHLRNHGFLRATTAGWSLSPAFDLNPDPRSGSAELATSIDGTTAAARIEPLLSVAPLFRLDRAQADEILRDVAQATGGWRVAAHDVGLPSTEIERMARAFEHDQADLARQR